MRQPHHRPLAFTPAALPHAPNPASAPKRHSPAISRRRFIDPARFRGAPRPRRTLTAHAPSVSPLAARGRRRSARSTRPSLAIPADAGSPVARSHRNAGHQQRDPLSGCKRLPPPTPVHLGPDERSSTRRRRGSDDDSSPRPASAARRIHVRPSPTAKVDALTLASASGDDEHADARLRFASVPAVHAVALPKVLLPSLGTRHRRGEPHEASPSQTPPPPTSNPADRAADPRSLLPPSTVQRNANTSRKDPGGAPVDIR
jgi:hypothetical protein